MALYGDLPTVKAFLRAAPNVGLDDADVDLRLTDIKIAVTAALEEKTGRTFGNGPAADITVLIWARNSAVLLLPTPARSITTVTVGGTVEGGTVTGGTVFDATHWAHDIVDDDGLIHALRLLSGGWWGRWEPVQVTAQFIGTDDDAVIPADLMAAATYLIAEEYKIRQASPAGFIGPDGATIPIRNPWNAPMVQAVISRYAVAPAVGLVV